MIPGAPRPQDPLAGYTVAAAARGERDALATRRQGHPAGGPWQLAGWWSRVGAQVIDGIVISVLAIVMLIVLGAIAGTGFAPRRHGGRRSALIVGVLVWRPVRGRRRAASTRR